MYDRSLFRRLWFGWRSSRRREPITIGSGPRSRRWRSNIGLEFFDRTRGGALAKEFVEAIREGVREAMTAGPLGGHPVTGVRVELLDGEAHVKDSTQLAFRVAANYAFREA